MNFAVIKFLYKLKASTRKPYLHPPFPLLSLMPVKVKCGFSGKS